MSVVGAEHPVIAECVLNAGGGMQRVRRVVIRIDDVSGSSGSRAGDASGIADISARGGWSIDGLKRRDPSVLRQIIEVEAEPGTNNRSAITGRVGDSQSWPESFAVVVGCAGHERNLESLQGQERRVFRLATPRPVKQAKRRVVAKPVVEG